MSEITTQKTLTELDLYINNKQSGSVKGWLDIHGTSIISNTISKKIKKNFPKIYIKYFPADKLTPVEEDKRTLDEIVARKYLNKLNNAKERGLDFKLTLTSVRNIMRAKKCYFTGLPLTRETTTIDRVNHNKGYILNNVVACHTDVNQFKALIESNTQGVGFKEVKLMMKRWEKRL